MKLIIVVARVQVVGSPNLQEADNNRARVQVVGSPNLGSSAKDTLDAT